MNLLTPTAEFLDSIHRNFQPEDAGRVYGMGLVAIGIAIVFLCIRAASRQ